MFLVVEEKVKYILQHHNNYLGKTEGFLTVFAVQSGNRLSIVYKTGSLSRDS